MLDAQADIVFLVDESYSDALSSTHAWLANHLVPQLESTLTDMDHDIDIRYGLIGFGETDDKGTPTGLGAKKCWFMGSRHFWAAKYAGSCRIHGGRFGLRA